MLGAALIAMAAMLTSPAPVSVEYWSVQAVDEDGGPKHYGLGLSELRPMLEDLPHDSFTLLGSGELTAGYGAQASADLTPEYRLVVEPVEQDDFGRVRMELSITYTAPGAAPVKAIDTRVLLSQDRKIRIGGMKLDRGELVLVLSPR